MKFRIKSSLIKIPEKILPQSSKPKRPLNKSQLKVLNLRIKSHSKQSSTSKRILPDINPFGLDQNLLQKVNLNPSFVSQISQLEKPLINNSSPWQIKTRNSQTNPMSVSNKTLQKSLLINLIQKNRNLKSRIQSAINSKKFSSQG